MFLRSPCVLKNSLQIHVSVRTLFPKLAILCRNLPDQIDYVRQIFRRKAFRSCSLRLQATCEPYPQPSLTSPARRQAALRPPQARLAEAERERARAEAERERARAEAEREAQALVLSWS